MNDFSGLLDGVAGGEEVPILSEGRVLARLVPPSSFPPRQFGRDRGLFEIPENFGSPLPSDLRDEFGT